MIRGEFNIVRRKPAFRLRRCWVEDYGSRETVVCSLSRYRATELARRLNRILNSERTSARVQAQDEESAVRYSFFRD